MGNCPSCEKKKWCMKILQCIICGKEGCSSCLVPLMDVFWGYLDSSDIITIIAPRPDKSRLYVCSDICKEKFSDTVEEKIMGSPIDIKEKEPDVKKYIDLVIVSNKLFIGNRILEGITKYPYEISPEGTCHDYYNVTEKLYQKLIKTAKIKRIELLKKVKRFEEAAEVYEELGMYSEAGKTRAEDKHVTVKKTEISVDLNSLLNQIRDGGLVVIYRCPHCNALMKITKDTKVASLKVCNHYKSAYEAIDVADILKTALS